MLQAQIFIDKDDLKGSKPLYEYIMQFLLEHKIAGATAFKGQTGYGPSQHLNRPHALFSFDEIPIVIMFIDEEEKVKSALTALRKEVKNGLIITHHVEKWQ